MEEMKSLSTFLFERFITAAKQDIQQIVDQYGDEILEILEYSYRDIGGCLGMQTKEDLIKECDLIKMVRRDGKIVALCCYAEKYHPNSEMPYVDNRKMNPGRKAIAGGAREGYAHEFKAILREDFARSERNAWGEFSGKAAVAALGCGALPIPVDVAEQIMFKKHFDVKKEDGYFYTRIINGKKHTKILMGNHLFYDHTGAEPMTDERMKEFKQLAKKYDQEDELL